MNTMFNILIAFLLLCQSAYFNRNFDGSIPQHDKKIEENKINECIHPVNEYKKSRLDPKNSLIFPFNVSEFNGIPTINVSVSGNKPENAIFDTGADYIFITESLSKKIDVKETKDHEFILLGKKKRGKLIKFENLKIMGITEDYNLTFKIANAIVLPDKDPLFPISKINKSKANIIFPGILLCDNFILQLDYYEKCLRISSFKSIIDFTECIKLPLNKEYGLPSISINNYKDEIYHFIFDTGANTTATPEDFWEEFRLKNKKNASLKMVLGKFDIEYIVIEELKFGELILKNFNCSLINKNQLPGFPSRLAIFSPLDSGKQLITLDMKSKMIYFE